MTVRAARRALLAALAATAVLASCTVSPPDDGSTAPTPTASPSPSPTPEPVLSAELRLPDAPATVLDQPDPVARATAVSETYFARAPLVVVAPVDDVAAQVRAASVAVGLGVPLLVSGPAEAGAPLAEIDRLGALAVVTVGAVPDLTGGSGAPDDDLLVVPAPGQDAALVRLLRTEATPEPAAAPEPGAELAAVAALDRTSPTLLGGIGNDTPAGTPSPRAGSPEGTATPAPAPTPSPSASLLPLTQQAPPLTGGLLLTTGDPTDLAAVATARAAGVAVVTVPGGDPRAASATVQAVAAAAPTATVGLGATFGAPETLAWTVATAATGVELPGGGQVLFPGRRLVALYGTPSFPGLGVLGEQDLPGSIARAQSLAAEYQALTPDAVVPAFEMIVTVASAGAGEDGNFSNELPVDGFVPWVEAARDAGVYVILDLQPGRTDFLTQAKAYEPLLLYPNVGLALDAEWRLAPDQVHLRQIGSVGVEEVNAVAAYLADVTRANALPQKLFVLHQFSLRMIQERQRVDTSRPELSVMINADGQGSQGAKAGTWRALRADAPPGVTWGWKNFVDEDVPMLTPVETYQVQPVPELVTYQ